MKPTNNNYDVIFWIAAVFAFLAGRTCAKGDFWLGAASFLFCLILITIKWIFIMINNNQSIEKEQQNE